MWTSDLDEGLPKPAAIVRALQTAIETGQLVANERLPPQRELAYAFGVNLSTVSRAMAEATKRGLIAGEVGRGTYVLPESPAAQLFQDAMARRDTIDLSTISPPDIDAGLLLNALRPSPCTDARNALGYPSPDLLDQARTAVRKWLDWRGLWIADGAIVLTAGAHAALQSLLPMLIQPGETVLTEEFTFPGIKTLSALTGIRLQGVPCDAQGLLPEALDHAVRSTKARVLVAVPNMQNPTAAVMGAQRRAEIAEVISRLGLTLVEDDIYGSYVGMPPLMSQLHGDHICISSLSKSVAPALRFGFLTGHHDAVKALADDMAVTSWFASPITLAAGIQLITSGAAMSEAARQRMDVQRRWQQVLEVFPDGRRAPATHLWLEVDHTGDFCAAALAHKVSVIPSEYFAVGRASGSNIRCSVTGAKDHDSLAEGLVILRKLGARIPAERP
jgi:DNA-binding transcriptional MocR family regulator